MTLRWPYHFHRCVENVERVERTSKRRNVCSGSPGGKHEIQLWCGITIRLGIGEPRCKLHAVRTQSFFRPEKRGGKLERKKFGKCQKHVVFMNEHHSRSNKPSNFLRSHGEAGTNEPSNSRAHLPVLRRKYTIMEDNVFIK